MAHPTRVFLDGSAKRNSSVNTIASPKFEDFTAATGGWTQSPALSTTLDTANPSPYNGSTLAASTPWAYCHKMATTAAVLRQVFGTFDAGGQILSLFVSRNVATPASTVKLNLQDSTNAVEHSVLFTFDTAQGVWTVTTETGGARGVVLPERYHGDLVRLAVVFKPGWTSDAGATAAGSNRRVEITQEASKALGIWGCQVELVSGAPDVYATLGHDNAATAFARATRPQPYLVGVGKPWKRSADGVLGGHPVRQIASTGLYQLSMLSSPTASKLLLQGRSDDAAPWVALSSIDQSGVNADGTLAAAVPLYPQMRLCILALDTAATLGAWLSE